MKQILQDGTASQEPEVTELSQESQGQAGGAEEEEETAKEQTAEDADRSRRIGV